MFVEGFCAATCWIVSLQEGISTVLNCGMTGRHCGVTQKGLLGLGISSEFKSSLCSFITYLMSAYYGFYTGLGTVLVF